MWYQWIISLPMMLCFVWSAFFAVRCFQEYNEPPFNFSILLFFIAATLLYTDHWLYFQEFYSRIGLYSYLVANLSVYPLYYVYLCALTRTKRPVELGLMLLPAALMALFFPLNARFEWLSVDTVFLFTRICFAIGVVWVWWRGHLLLKQTSERLDDTYSDDRSRLLHPTFIVQHLLAVTAAFSTLLNLLGRDFFADSMMVCLPAAVMSVLIFSIGYVAAHTTLPKESVEADAESNRGTVSNEEINQLIPKIDNLMRTNQLYTNSNLTILDLAAAVGSNRTYVSAAINRTYGVSFSLYVAKQRVEYAKMILADHRYTSDKAAIADAYALSGFASKQSFYRVFKEITSLTPLAFRKSQLG